MGNSPQCLAVEGRLAALIGEAGEAISALHWCNVCQSVKPEKLDPCVAVWGNSPHWFGQFGITRCIGLDCSEKPEKLVP